MKKYNVAYIKNHIDWDRNGIFDKYLIRALLERADVDIYANNVPEKTPSYLEGKMLGRFRAFRFRSFGPTFLSYFHVYLKLKRLERGYDFLVTDWEFFNVANALLDSKKSIIYFQTPERSFYDLYDFRILTKRNPLRRLIQHLWNRQRILDNFIVRQSKNALIFGNSNNVAKRIYKTYLKEAVVLYPAPAVRTAFAPRPVEELRGKRFFLTVNRIAREKRIEIMIEAFRKIPDRHLAIVGWFGTDTYASKLKRLADGLANVHFLERVSDEEINWLYANCEAAIQTSLDEDYGMVPSEAMEAGKPVIAVAEGGFCETIISRFNGVLLIQPYVENLRKAIRAFNPVQYDSKAIKEYVKQRFSYAAFAKGLWANLERQRRGSQQRGR